MTKVLVGLSGGVDSAVAAYLLKEQGYDVECCFMRNWDSALNNDTLGNPTLNDDICPQEKDYNDAKKVAEKLGLKLHRVDYIKEYWDDVFENFISEYKEGRTPNPDILCNKYIKFDAFLNYAKANGYDKMATGHYAKNVIYKNEELIGKAHDLNKDQSYFLAQVSKEAIEFTLFPLGEIDKPQVRRIAHELELDIADKKDSTGVCFIGERNFREFLKNYIPMKEGNIIDIETKEVIGRHDGVYYYTIGQRKGFKVGGSRGPYFCVGKNVYKNELYLATKNDHEWLYSDSCHVKDFNFMFRPETGVFKATAKFRYRQCDNNVTVRIIDDTNIMIEFDEHIKAVTKGQQAVVYMGDVMIGGGVIDEVYLNGKEKDEILKEYLEY
ncbi:MAG: tRNA 2-thiouridine(34) synthase MnmA [Erysipelotrichaceae bacterium]|nr:tRNA 2-thiouridine(34) synthase MnmA [Erysipelotrichaceae bacterium]